MRVLPLFFACLLSCASASTAATLNETLAGGFSSDPTDYTAVGRDFNVISGTLTGSEDDFLQFTSLDAGAQTFSFDISLAPTTGRSQATGRVRVFEAFSPNPFFPGTTVGDFRLNTNRQTSTTLSFSLPDTFAGGDLFVGLLSFSGNGLPYTYSLSVTGNGGGGPAPIPLPASGVLLLGALMAGGLLRRGRAMASKDPIAA